MYPLFIAVVVMWIDDLKAEKLNNKLKTAIIFVLIWSALPANWSCIAFHDGMGHGLRDSFVFLCKQGVWCRLSWRHSCLSISAYV